MSNLHEQFRAAGIACFPCWARYDQKKGKYDKGPNVPKGQSWKDVDLEDSQLDWSSGVVGVPVPEGIVILDLDSYEGATREGVEAHIGAQLDWDRARIQNTISGGEHYAFRVSWPVKQGASIGFKGFDTRVAGKGFIATGRGYEQQGALGVFALAYPHLLPQLPEATRPVLEKIDTSSTGTTAPVDETEVTQALKFLDPGAKRDDWIRVAMALKSLFKDDDTTGLAVFDAWSCGSLWSGDEPANYVSHHVTEQWNSLKANDGITGATLFYKAIQAGWKPPPKLDVGSAFSAGASEEVFSRLVERIRSDGPDVTMVEDLVKDIKSSGCSELQVALLAAELKTELADAGLKDAKLLKAIDKLLHTKTAYTPPGMYGKSDAENANLFLDKFFPTDTLARSDGRFYRYTGTRWEYVTDDTMTHMLTKDMAAQMMQQPRIASAKRMVWGLVPTRDGEMNQPCSKYIAFNNGILDIQTGQLWAHDKSLFTTQVLPYDYTPEAQCPRWLEFLSDIFSGDIERHDLLQQWLGYMLARDYSHQKMLLMLGGSRSGKGTIGRILKELVGEHNFSGGSLSSFAKDSFIDGISDKTVLFIGDAQRKVGGGKSSEVTEYLKTISGNDDVSWHRMYHGNLSKALPTRITISANSMPQFFDDSGALGNRFLILTFDKSYLGKEDTTLGGKLSTEISGIANWAIEGLRKLRQVGRFVEPAVAAQEREFMEGSYSPLSQFIRECLEYDPNGRVATAEMYQQYKAWCLAVGEEISAQKSFTRALRDAARSHLPIFYNIYRDGHGVHRGWNGCVLKDSAPKLFPVMQASSVTK